MSGLDQALATLESNASSSDSAALWYPEYKVSLDDFKMAAEGDVRGAARLPSRQDSARSRGYLRPLHRLAPGDRYARIDNAAEADRALLWYEGVPAGLMHSTYCPLPPSRVFASASPTTQQELPHTPLEFKLPPVAGVLRRARRGKHVQR